MNVLTKKAQNPFSHLFYLYQLLLKHPVSQRLWIHLIVQFLLYGIITFTYGWVYSVLRALTSGSLPFYFAFVIAMTGAFWLTNKLEVSSNSGKFLISLFVICWGLFGSYLLLVFDMLSFFSFRYLIIEPQDYTRLWENVFSFMLPALTISEIVWHLSFKWRGIALSLLGLCVIGVSIFIYCSQASFDKSSLFTNHQKREILNLKKINEASGLVASQQYPHIIWTHNDGPINHLYGIDTLGNHQATFDLRGISPRDVEDIAISHDLLGEKNYIYLADIGDNYTYYHQVKIYRFPEPTLLHSAVSTNSEIQNIEEMWLRYPDGKRDAEALMVDPLDQHIYIISKREAFSRLYLAGTFEPTDAPQTMEYLFKLPFRSVVAADISADGQEVLIKTYRNIYYWKRQEGESIPELLARTPLELSYTPEPQGEAIAWASNQKGYFTLSEHSQGIEPRLYFYERVGEVK